MSGELKIPSTSGQTVYAQVLSPTAQRWNNSTLLLETYTAGHYSQYDVPMVEQGASGVYIGNFPTAITVAGEYEIFYYSGTGVQGDTLVGTGVIEWNGTAAIFGTVPNALSGSAWHDYVLRVFKRTDKDTELYEETGETIREIRRRGMIGSDEIEEFTTDTITVLGDYQINTEDNLSLFVSDVVVVDSTNSWQLTRISKSEFDYLYPNPTAQGIVRSKPVHYCIFGDKIIMGPVPDKTSYQYKVSMTIDDFVAITAGTTAVPYSNKYKNMLRAGVLKRLFEGVENYQTSGYWGQQFENWFNQLQEKQDHNADAVHNVKYNDY